MSSIGTDNDELVDDIEYFYWRDCIRDHNGPPQAEAEEIEKAIAALIGTTPISYQFELAAAFASRCRIKPRKG